MGLEGNVSGNNRSNESGTKSIRHVKVRSGGGYVGSVVEGEECYHQQEQEGGRGAAGGSGRFTRRLLTHSLRAAEFLISLPSNKLSMLLVVLHQPRLQGHEVLADG